MDVDVSFLEVAKRGRNAWWLYLVGILLIFLSVLIGYVVVSIPIGVLLAGQLSLGGGGLDSEQAGIQIQRMIQESTVLSYWLTSAPLIFLGLGTFFVVTVLHRRNFWTLVSGDRSFNPKRFLSGFAVWFLFACLQTIGEFVLTPQSFSWNFQIIPWLTFLPLALIVTPLQTSAEELFFRGYLLQGLGLLTRQPIVLAIASSLPFATVHFANPEMARGAIWMGLSYFALAAFLALITLKDNRLELALGVHAANNLFIVLFANTKDSVIQSPAMILQTIPSDPRVGLVVLIIMACVFYYLFFGLKQRI
jgi:membrane protease YdiL (CAAX protease family)